jgi:hypothetical protein
LGRIELVQLGVRDLIRPELNGRFTVLDVPSQEAAVEWAAKIAAAGRCGQEIREFMPNPAVGN